MGMCSCCESGPVKRLVFVVLIVYGFITVFADWMWARDVLLTEKGLVFGPYPVPVQWLIVAIAIISSVAYVAEVIYMVLDTFYDKELLDEDVEQILGLFFQEVPQVTMSMYISACREAAVSIFQMVKASVAILGSLIRLIIVIALYFLHHRKHRSNWVARVVLLLAALYTFLGSVTVFTFIFTTRPDLGFRFKPPTSLINDNLDEGRYFYKSGVYLSHPDFAVCNNNTEPWDKTRINWIKLASIYDVRDGTVNAGFDRDDAGNNFLYIIYYGNGPKYYCYNITGCDIQQTTQCPGNYTAQNQASLYMRFNDIRTSSVQPLGDITFRANIASSGQCNTLRKNHVGLLSLNMTTVAQLQYFRAKPDVNDTSSFFYGETGGYRYYVMGRDLQNVTEAWKTGYATCPMTGSLAPTPNDQLYIRCEI